MVIDSGSDNITLDDSTNVAGNLELGDNQVGTDAGRMCYNGTQTVWEGYSNNGSLWSCGVNNTGSFVCLDITGSGFTCT